MNIKIKGEFIKLGQFLKKIEEIDSGGQAKLYLQENNIKINGKTPEGRSSKIYINDIVWVNNDVYKITSIDSEI
ncbi:RNA-binding S4 domain-containing protein [Mycoplasma sp. 246B]